MRIPGSLAMAASIVAILPCKEAMAAPQEFDFKDPKGVNTIVFVLDSKLEPIMGLATGIGGTITYDPAEPTSFSGRIVVDAESVRCALPAMTNVLHSADWMDVEQFPTVEMKFKKIKSSEATDEHTVELKIVADLTCHGETREMLVPVSATYLAGELGKRLRGRQGDLLVLRSKFSIPRSDFGIKPNMGPTQVAEQIELRVAITGMAPTP